MARPHFQRILIIHPARTASANFPAGLLRCVGPAYHQPAFCAIDAFSEGQTIGQFCRQGPHRQLAVFEEQGGQAQRS